MASTKLIIHHPFQGAYCENFIQSKQKCLKLKVEERPIATVSTLKIVEPSKLMSLNAPCSLSSDANDEAAELTFKILMNIL